MSALSKANVGAHNPMFHHQFRSGEKGHAEFDKLVGSQAVLDVEGRQFQILDVGTIGRAPGSDILLTEPSVSRNHARIFREGGHYWLKDLESANGTTLNGKRVKLQMLGDGDEIAFGQAKGIFHVSGGAPGPALIASDPLEGEEEAISDGTPTGGLVGEYGTDDQARIRQLEGELETMRRLVATKDKEIDTFAARSHSWGSAGTPLHSEALADRKEGTETSISDAAQDNVGELVRENERLQRLVRHLERALADCNVRIKNLQDRLDPNRY